MRINCVVILICCLATLLSCNNSIDKKQAVRSAVTPKDNGSNQSNIVYKTDHLSIQKLSDHVYRHESFLSTKDFGKVPCNGMVVINQNEIVVFDTPADEKSAVELIKYFTEKLKSRIIAVVATHFHEDCVAGMNIFFACGIPAYASNKTISLLRAKGRNFSQPINGFNDSLSWNIGDKKVYAHYFGEGHTRDNIVGYFPNDNAVFGGCLIKELNATKGNLEDANTDAWSQTVKNIKQHFPAAKIVIPGHGKWGDYRLFDYTIKLFEAK